MKHYITVYEFTSGLCLMNWFMGYTDPESGAFVQVNNKWARIALADLFAIDKIYKRIDQTIGSSHAIWYYEYKG